MSIDSPEARMQKSGAFWMAFIGFALIGAVAMVVVVPGIERELADRSSAALSKFDWLGIEVDGRTLILTGAAPHGAARQDMISTARRITPHLQIDDRTSVNPADPIVIAPILEHEPVMESESPLEGESTVEVSSKIDTDQVENSNLLSSSDAPIEATAATLRAAESRPAPESNVVLAESETVPDPAVEPLPIQSPTPSPQQVPANECQARIDAAMRSEIIRFSSGSTEVLKASYPLLTDISRVAVSCNARIEVSGHTDDLGEEAENVALSLRRAEAVTEFLVSQGVQPDTLSARGYGEAFPVQANTTWAGRKANRRIAFKVLQDEDLGSELDGQESP